MNNKISVLIPVLNEQGNITDIYVAVKEVLMSLQENIYEIIFIDDGSSDATLKIIKGIAKEDSAVLFISFSRNFGKDKALSAGIIKSKGAAVITIDSDLQHPPLLIKDLILQWKAGYEVVYYYRKNKNGHVGSISQFFSSVFYRTLNAFADVKLESGISDFRIMDRKIVDVLAKMNEENIFFRGLVKWVGFKQLGLEYTPIKRNNGKSRYKKTMLLSLAINSITSFSVKPLTFAIYLGFLFSFLSLLYIPYAIFSKLHGIAISGWASTIVTIAFFGGLNLLILGIVGLYLGKTFMQGKGRPLYLINESNIEI